MEAGIDPAALVDAKAQEQREAAQAELAGAPRKRGGRTAAEIYAMLDSYGDVKRVIRNGEPDELQRLYEALDVQMTYNAEGRMVDVTIRPVARDKAGVGGGSRRAVVRRAGRAAARARSLLLGG